MIGWGVSPLAVGATASADAERPADATGRMSLTMRIYNDLWQEIVSGTIEPGAKLKVELIQARYGCGGTPVREALSLLTAGGFVRRLDQRGFQAASATIEEFDELLDTRCFLEKRALSETMARSNAGWEEELVLVTHRLSTSERQLEAERPDELLGKWERLHRAFHMKLIEHCGSRFLFQTCGWLYDHNVRYRRLAGNVSYPGRSVREEHRSITEAVLARDTKHACDLLVRHYTETGSYLRKLLGAGQRGTSPRK